MKKSLLITFALIIIGAIAFCYPQSIGQAVIDTKGNIHTNANLSIIKDRKSVRVEE